MTMMMTDLELEALREKLIQTASEIDLAVEAIEKILMPIEPELNPAKPVRWGKADPAEYWTPTTHTLTEREILAHANQRIIEGWAPPWTFEIDDDDDHAHEGTF